MRGSCSALTHMCFCSPQGSRRRRMELLCWQGRRSGRMCVCVVRRRTASRKNFTRGGHGFTDVCVQGPAESAEYCFPIVFLMFYLLFLQIFLDLPGIFLGGSCFFDVFCSQGRRRRMGELRGPRPPHEKWSLILC